MPKQTKSSTKVEKLCELLEGKRSLLIVMQDHPDPDSIASAAALRRVAHSVGDIQCSITYGGVIGRAENRALADYLALNFRPIDQVDATKFDAVALVDTQPGTGNNSLPEEVWPDIVLDHHPMRDATRGVTFTDVRSKYGALSTMLFEYLAAAGITPGPPLATALLYAVRTDTQDLGRQAVQADVRALEALYPLANTRMLSEIQRGEVDSEYFRTVAAALDQAHVQGKCVYAFLDEVPNADIVAEIADLFLRYHEADWAMCGGFFRGKAWFSLRTSQSELSAVDVVAAIVTDIGTGGGHPMAAAGQIVLEKGTKAEQSRIQEQIRERFVREIGESRRRAKKLLSLRTGKANANDASAGAGAGNGSSS